MSISCTQMVKQGFLIDSTKILRPGRLSFVSFGTFAILMEITDYFRA